MENPCPHVQLAFQGHIAAPGFGQAWKCKACGEPMWSPGGALFAQPYKDLDASSLELGPEDVI